MPSVLNTKTTAVQTVVVGMSGGVDSSVTAALLKEQGYRVIGLFMKNWDEKDENGICEASKDFADVVRVCEKLDIPYYSVEFVEEYRTRVFENFLEELKKGYTPNPDILCNREIKFDAFYDKAMELGADYLATGHYCRTIMTESGPKLLKGLDPLKDQSYFLHAINGKKLAQVMFPIGDLPKTRVREIAAKYDLATKDKKDSTGICFIGERNFKPFVAQYLKSRPGNFKTLDGKIVGTHSGAQFYTLGQRKGLGLGGQGEPWFVVGKNIQENTVIVERGETHPSLYTDECWAEELTWISGVSPEVGSTLECRAKARYRQSDQDCTVTIENSRAHVKFHQPQRSVTPGQSVVFYQGDECLGGGVIRTLGLNHFEQSLLSKNKDISVQSQNC
jgi:tRNA-specific 2-thiouridylase